ncbi:MAG: phosphate acyltransferase PlsX [Elusimicrobiaceae bacterium]|nr:phosphate acyltransferase PlsX [Elusimicrobiaceae bacterium]
MKIALDALGGDFGAHPNVLGALQAVKKLEIDVILVGDETVLRQELAALGHNEIPAHITIVHAPQTIDMGAEPAKECRSKKDASIVVCADLVHKKQADAFVSAGHSGAAMVAALFGLGRIKGVQRPAIATPMPTYKGVSLLLDAGANADCKPIHLLQFAVMGSAYMQKVFDIPAPSGGILSIGEEETKGNMLVKHTVPHMRDIGINFKGTVEGRDVNAGDTDVIVCDGFVGNIVLKMAEGMAKAMIGMIKREVKKRPQAMVGALLSRGAFKAVKKHTNPDCYGGAPLVGVNGVAIISHGKSNDFAIFNALKTAARLVEKNFIGDIAAKMDSLKPTFDKLEQDIQQETHVC